MPPTPSYPFREIEFGDPTLLTLISCAVVPQQGLVSCLLAEKTDKKLKEAFQIASDALKYMPVNPRATTLLGNVLKRLVG